MGRLEDSWLPRIGVEATRTLMRAVFLSRIGVGIAICFGAASITSEWQKSQAGEAISITGGFLGMTIFAALSIRLQTRARRQAESYLDLPPGSWKYLTVRSQAKFDRWLAARDKAGWPATGWR